jgi:hypothetical protein
MARIEARPIRLLDRATGSARLQVVGEVAAAPREAVVLEGDGRLAGALVVAEMITSRRRT